MSDVKVILGGRLVDGTGTAPIEDSALIIKGKRIKTVGTRRDVKIPAGALEIDATGKTVMPGLIESHSHPLGERGLELGFKKYYDNLLSPSVLPVLKGVKDLRSLLQHGVTTVRILHGAIPSAPDMRGRHLVALRTAVERGYFPAPRVVAAGCVFPTAGHIYAMAPPTLVKPEWSGADGIWEVRKQTRQCLAEGVDIIKLLGPTGGGGHFHDAPKVQGMTLEEIEAAVEESHWRGVPVSAHAHGGGGLTAAVQAGVDTIEHGTFLCEQPGDLAMMAEKGIILVPTSGVRTHPVYGYLEDAEKGLPDEESAQNTLETIEASRKSIRMAREAGVKIAAGTDFMRFDISPLAWELHEYVAHGGMTPLEAIVSATKTAAEACGLKDVGTLEPGKIADIIVVDGDPLSDINILQDQERFKVVITEGCIQIDDGALTW
jgi:imidazolonepropionase-like amidohydrolase